MITLISGTNRPDSNTRNVTRILEGIYRDLRVQTHVIDLHVIDLQELPPALFLPEAYATKPPAFTPFVQAGLDASGQVVVTPEYNGSMPGS